MFPSSNSSCSNPFSYTYERPFCNDPNPNISGPEEHSSSSFLHDFPSPFLGNDELLQNHLFSQQQLLAATQPPDAEISAVDQLPSEVVSKKRSASGGKNQTQTRKRTTGKKDRHSKIYTAQGPRDRRMRLSLQIARKFFDLQDMLGFDKASKTIEWLFTKSKASIKELVGSLPQVKRSCYASECETRVSEIKETSNINEDYKEVICKGDTLVGVKNEKKPRNPAFHPLSKDCRDKARARARERTREKMIRNLEKSKQCFDANPNYLEHATGSSSPFDAGDESSSPSQDMNFHLKAATEVEEEPAVTHLLEHQMATVGIIDKYLGIASSTLASPSILNYSYNVAAESRDGIYSNDDFLDFQGGWSMENASIKSNFCARTDHMDPNSTGDVYQQQNPNSSFMITSNIHSQSQYRGN